MKTTKHPRFALLFALFAVWALAGGHTLFALEPEFTVTTPRNVIGADDDLVITLTLANPTDEQHWFDNRPYVIDLRDSEGSAVPNSAYGAIMEQGVSFGSQVHPLAAHSKKIDHVNLSDWFNIPGPGTYTLTVSRAGETAAPLVITIVPAPHSASAPELPASDAHAREAAAVASSGPRQRDLSLFIETDRPSVFRDAPIHLHAILSNRSADMIRVPFDSSGSAFGVDVRGPSGEPVPDSPLTSFRRAFSADPAHALPRFPLERGAQIPAEVELASLADMKSPGTYSVQLYLKLPESLGGGEIRSNLLFITVKPRQTLP